LSAIRDTGATFVQAATPFLSDILREIDNGHRPPETLRIFVVTGATVPREVARRATDALGATVSGAWGTTETCLGTLAPPDEAPELMWGTDGKVLPGVDLRVTCKGEVLAPGAEGELEVRTPTMFAEYFQRPLRTVEAFTLDGWYQTGDLATISPSGHLKITGRLTDIINRGGEKVPVAEVEQLLHAHPAVREAAIVAMPDERLGERACAFLAVANGGALDLTALREYLADLRVTRQYWPERVEIIDALPRTSTGKIQRNVLRAQAAKLVEAGS
jgi:3-phosphoshikimate 1-carboxyvinyltransferase